MLDDDLLNLKIISQIPPYGRIKRGSYGTLAIETNSFYVSHIFRWARGYSRAQSVIDIEKTIDSVLFTVKEMYNSKLYDDEIYPVEFSKRKDRIVRFYKAMCKITGGLINLKETYNSDVTTSSKIDILLDKVKFFVSEYAHLHTEE
jgi:hypothetical protein